MTFLLPFFWGGGMKCFEFFGVKSRKEKAIADHLTPFLHCRHAATLQGQITVGSWLWSSVDYD